MIDLSDGVATDLYHLCQAGGVGARLKAAAVPLSAGLAAAPPGWAWTPCSLALTGGEDYQLLFTSPPAGRRGPERAFSRAGLAPPRALGEIVAGRRVLLVTETGEMDISGQGYDHFRLDLAGQEI